MPDGRLSLPGGGYNHGERFRHQSGTAAFWSAGGDESSVNAAQDWADYQYVFFYRERGWWQQGTLVLLTSDELPCDDFPQLASLRLNTGGQFTFEGVDYGATEELNSKTSDAHRIRKLQGSDAPIIAVNSDDDYVGIIFQRGAWCMFSPRIPLSNRSPWRKLPSVSWEPELVPAIPALTLLREGRYSVGSKVLGSSDPLPLILCHSMYRYEKGGGSDAPLCVKPIDGEQEWQLLFTDGEWTVRTEWTRIVEETIVEGVLRCGEGYLQHIPNKRTYRPDEEIAEGDPGGALVKKAKGDRNLVYLSTERGRWGLAYHDRAWHLLSTTHLRPLLTRPHEIAASPAFRGRDFASFVRHLLRLDIVAALPRIRALVHAFSRIARLGRQGKVWVPASDRRFGAVRAGVITALEPLAIGGLGLYHDGRIRVGREIYGPTEEINLSFGTSLVRRHAHTNIVMVREFDTSWSEIRLRHFAGRWERLVGRSERDKAEVILFDLFHLIRRRIRDGRRWLAEAYRRYRHHQSDL